MEAITTVNLKQNKSFHTNYLLCHHTLFPTKILGTVLQPKPILCRMCQGFPGGSDGKESACNAGDPGLIPESGRSPAEGNGNSLQYSCLENPMYRGAWWATIHEVAESDTTKQLTHICHRGNTRIHQD